MMDGINSQSMSYKLFWFAIYLTLSLEIWKETCLCTEWRTCSTYWRYLFQHHLYDWLRFELMGDYSWRNLVPAHPSSRLDTCKLQSMCVCARVCVLGTGGVAEGWWKEGVKAQLQYFKSCKYIVRVGGVRIWIHTCNYIACVWPYFHPYFQQQIAVKFKALFVSAPCRKLNVLCHLISNFNFITCTSIMCVYM